MIHPSQPDFRNTPASALRPKFDYAPLDSSAKPVLSIITPFFDAGGVFRETAGSIFAQSLQQWEWIIVNDGSSNPEALALLDEYRGKDSRIRVVDHEVNKGLSAARNTGFRHAQTDYVFQLDADDLIEPTTLEKLWW